MSRRNRSRTVVIGGLCVAAAVGILLRTGFGSGTRSAKAARPAADVARRAKRTAEAPPPPILSPEDARKARAAAIRETREAILAECRAVAAGDWDRWSAQLAPLRDDLAAQIRAAKPMNPAATGWFEARSAVLAGKGSFPLIEAAPDHYLRHIVEPASLDPFRNDRPVVAGARWLAQKGIAVVFVPVPKMTEIYPEPFTDHAPADGIIAPHIRRAILDLLEADVEVVDLLPAFRKARSADTAEGLLYQPADPHWAPRAQAIAARMIAERLARYDFVARAQASPPLCDWIPIPYPKANEGAAFDALTAEQQRRAIEAQPRTHMMAANCKGSMDDEHAPIVCIGDSYNGGLMDELRRSVNLPVRNLSGGGNTTEAFKDFLRDPELLKEARVVIWLVCNSSLKAPWPMPQKIRQAAAAESSGR